VPTTLTASSVSEVPPALLPVPGGGIRVIARVVAAGGQGSLVERTWLPGSGWQAERVIATGLIYEVTASVSPEDHVFVVFPQQVSSGGSYWLKVARLQSGAAEWTPPRTMGTSTYPGATINRVQALSLDRVSVQFSSSASGTTTAWLGLANWATSSLGFSTISVDDSRACLDEDGRLSTLRVQTAGTNRTYVHYRSPRAGEVPQFLRDLVTLPTDTVMGSVLVCSQSGRARFMIETWEAPPGPGSRMRSWDFL
jgi:hypothetical protein